MDLEVRGVRHIELDAHFKTKIRQGQIEVNSSELDPRGTGR